MTPTSTYRLQIHGGFGFDAAAEIAGYLDRLGVTHAYLAPILQATPGSTHGYDVVDHATVNAEAGGVAGFRRLVAALAGHGLAAVADLVPNHMAVPTPVRLNQPLWSVLRDGPDSPYAAWFDIDWAPGQLLMPVLGEPIGEVVAAGELAVDRSGPEPVLRYFEHEFPLRPGTHDLPLPELLARQWYRLAWWRTAAQELNYRRFFDVTTLAAIRVELPEVFDASHELILALVRDGSLQGLRIDHPDGLADPRGYLRRLADASGGTWVVVEKILEDGELLPADWPCAGTTGYDALNLVGGLFVDPAGRGPLDQQASAPLAGMVESAKREVASTSLVAEIDRLTGLLVQICAGSLGLRDHTRASLRSALVGLLVELDRYRANPVPGEPVPAESAAVLRAAAGRACAGNGDEQVRAALDAVLGLAMTTLSGDPVRDEFAVRFQQTCGPVMAKGIEDTTFYRWDRLYALNEVGASPHRFGYSPGEFHDFCERIARDWPGTMTTLSTHDTKRSEDARARMLAVSQLPAEWAAAQREWAELAAGYRPTLPASVDRLLWQTLVALWSPAGPPEVERITAYLQKALREQKWFTTWTDPDQAFEAAVEAFARGALADARLIDSLSAFVARLAAADRVNLLGQKLIQLTMPGVADVYQGCELVDRSLVDPDNRRPVDYARRSLLLERLDAGHSVDEFPEADRLDAAKLLVTSRALRTRRAHPDWFVGGGYAMVGTSTDHALAFGRGPSSSVLAVTVATRLSESLAAAGGWREHTVHLPPGSWTDALTGRPYPSGPTRLADLLATLPVALLTTP